MGSQKRIQLTEFVKRQFSENFVGTKIKVSPSKFEKDINEKLPLKVIEGYAPFCKLFFLENWMSDVKSGTMPINRTNEKYLKSGYVQRTRDELPVLTRWFEGIPAPVARYIVLVAYTMEQLLKENPCEPIESDYGIVAILGQMHDSEEPMNPITMMRNALGIKEGGSGFPMDRKKYLASVDFWDKNANVKITKF